ncbi:unnamed protein product, partial [Lampetra fluviatilis]
MPRLCESCGERRAALRRPKTSRCVCRPCFSSLLEHEVHGVVTAARFFRPGLTPLTHQLTHSPTHPGLTVALGASGGKDSTVLAYLMKLLNDRHGYGLKLVLLSVDEGIAGYRDDSLATVKRNQAAYALPLTVVSYEQLYGWTMDQVVEQVGTRGTCTYCGVLRRQALERGARRVGADLLATGHNADDLAETALMNVLRGDGARLARSTGALTPSHGDGAIPRCKPLMYCYEKEIVLYAYFNRLDYFSTECVYSPGAYRGRARALLKDLERVRPRTVIDVVHSAQRCWQASGKAGPGWELGAASGPRLSDGAPRTWFHFGVSGSGTAGCGKLLCFTVVNMNRQSRLYAQGATPLVRTVPGRTRWEPLTHRPTFQVDNGEFTLTFHHRLVDAAGSTTYFAFCYPYSYEQNQRHLQLLDQRFSDARNLTPDSPPDSVFYQRELLVRSLCGLRVDLLTVTDCRGMGARREPRLGGLFPSMEETRPPEFPHKKVFLLTARVHPGETPSSFVLRGFLEFIVRPHDARAAALRRRFLFKLLVPMLNPDGVQRGHY